MRPIRLVIAAGIVEGLLERVGAEEGDVARLGLQARRLEDLRQLHALPLADAAPALDAIVAGDLRARGQRAQVGERKLHRPLDQAADFELPVLEAAVAQRDIGRIVGIDRAVRLEPGRDRAWRKFPRHRRLRPQQGTLGGLGQAFRLFQDPQRRGEPESQPESGAAAAPRPSPMSSLRRVKRGPIGRMGSPLIAGPP